MNKQTVLHVIDGDCGLVSMDTGCIESILYAKLCKVPIELKILNGIKSCALYSAPTLQCGDIVIENTSKIIAYLNIAYGSPDRDLTSRQSSETLALISLTYKLKSALDYLSWVDQRNSDEFVSRWYMAAMPFPFNYSYTKRKKNEATQLMEVLYPLDDDLEVIKDFISKSATMCLSTLSTRLGNSKYFHGDTPTSLDCVVYAHVAPLIKLPFPNNELSSSFSMWPNLVEFVKRIDLKYFPTVKKDAKYLKSEEDATKQSDDEVSYMAIFILAVSATTLAVGFALKRGFIRLSRH